MDVGDFKSFPETGGEKNDQRGSETGKVVRRGEGQPPLLQTVWSVLGRGREKRGGELRRDDKR